MNSWLNVLNGDSFENINLERYCYDVELGVDVVCRVYVDEL